LSRSPDPIETRIGYRFEEPRLLAAALTHRSAGAPHNERLEFLGDGALNFIIAEALFRRLPRATEGELSRLRATLVNGATLAELARDLEMGDFLRLGPGELKSGGHRRESILADALEAVIGAVYLDGGFEACRAVVLGLWSERLDSLPDAASLKDPKTRLQEWLQARGRALPRYELVEARGAEHARVFRIVCTIDGIGERFAGEGSSRRKAEQAAAAAALAALAGD